MPIDYSKYPVNWKTEIRPRIMARANNRCEWPRCDLKHLERAWSVGFGKGKRREWYRNHKEAEQPGWLEMKTVKVIITIAHLDHDESNKEIKDNRLMAMCQLHHLRYDAKEKSKTRALL